MPAWDLAEQREASVSFFSLKLQHGINGSVSYLQVFRYLFPSDQSKLELNGM